MRTAFNDLTKDSVRRLLARAGLRLQKAAYLPYSYERKNYSQFQKDTRPVIFDVGANIGQSATWYASEFPDAEIHCFEPFESIFAMLQRSAEKCSRIIPHRIALGASKQRIEVPRINDPLCQTGSIASRQDGSEMEWIEIDTVDSFSARNGIDTIQILKTDTEGHDLEVLNGAREMLQEGKISCVLSESTIQTDDKEHTQLAELQIFLEEYQFSLHSILDLHHAPDDGRLLYFNALFIRKPKPD